MIMSSVLLQFLLIYSGHCSFEARLVETVVNDLINTLDTAPLEVAKHPVGLDSVKNALIQKLNLNSVYEVVKVGIWGIGGIGKTTVAKAVYNEVYADFEAASFIFNVGTTAADPTGLTKLQKQILKDLSKYDGRVHSVDKGISLFRDRLGGKRVLLILDDVDDVVQLNALVGDWLAPGSRVIITSRDKHILHGAECILEMSGLDVNEGLQLFSWHAFLRASPNPRYEDMSKKIVEACKGHPLSLEMIGSFLYDKQDDTDYWTEALRNINPDIHSRLYISYSALSNIEKEIFVDIACFFIGEHRRFPIVFWKSLHSSSDEMVDAAVLHLSMKLLIKIDEKGVFHMHDHLRDMGRTIAEVEKGRTRLWEAAHLSTLYNDTNLSRLRLNGGNPHGLKMLCRPGLRYLDLRNLFVEGTIEDMLAMLPPGLIWLRLEDCTFSIGKNRAINKPPGSMDKIGQLKIMQLKFCQGVDSFSISLISLPSIELQYLDLRGCGKLNTLPDTIGHLSQLEHLDLGGCGSLDNLPDTIGHLSQLQHLDLGGCGSLDSLPDTIGQLSQLQYLDLGGCGSLNSLPDSIGKLSQLQHLDLRGCGSLNSLPNTIGYLSQLQQLNMEGCGSLEILSNVIGNLSELLHLNLRGCTRLNNLPDSIGKLSQLQHLDLGGCGSLNSLPDSIGHLSQLQHLDLEGCGSLNSLRDTIGHLSQLQHLDLGGCGSLNSLPDTIGHLSQLQHLDLGRCGSLYSLPDAIGFLSQLQHLDLGGCRGLDSLPGTICYLSQLQHLDLGGCGSLNSLSDSIGNLSQLQHLDLGGCGSLNSLPESIGHLSQLQHLDLGGCGSLNSLPDSIGHLSQLLHLNLGGCTRLDYLPYSIGHLSQLQYLDLRGCGSLSSLPHTIGQLSQLQHLDLEGCTTLNNLPDTIGNLSQLQILNLEGCASLNNLPDTIGNLSQLQILNLKGCRSLNNLPSTIENLSQLENFDFEMLSQINWQPVAVASLGLGKV